MVETLDPDGRQSEPLQELIEDPDALDRLLDDPALFHRLLDAPRLLDVSPYFFYYISVRRSFIEHGIDERRVADYVGALLSHHLEANDEAGYGADSMYLVDLIAAIGDARSAEEAFELQTGVADRALFLSGLFPDWIYHRETFGRRPVSLSYFEDMGRRYYRVAAGTRTARERDLHNTLSLISRRFDIVRQALNDLSDEHLHLGGRGENVDRLCRRTIYRARN